MKIRRLRDRGWFGHIRHVPPVRILPALTLIAAASTLLSGNAAASPPTVEVVLIHTTLTSSFLPPSPDPSGLAYLPSSGQLIISDGEVDEMPGYFEGDNVFVTSLSGELARTSTTISFSSEPNGVAFDAREDHFFFSDDDRRRIFELDMGNDGLQGTTDDVLTSFSTRDFGSEDPEGLAFDSVRRRLFVVDGQGEEVFEINPGANQLFDGVPPSGDDLVRHYDTTALGLQDPEGIEYDAQSDLLYVLSGPSRTIGEITPDGTLVRAIDFSSVRAVAPAGLAYAPASNGDPEKHLYVVDRGIDNNTRPDENDGKLYEVAFPASRPVPTFADVPFDHPFFAEIEALYRADYTAGCNADPLMYCPDNTMNRAESAVFVERGIHGTTELPSQPTTQVFADLPLDSWAAKWAHALWEDHYTAGCGTDPLIYCPWQGHTRAEGAVFYLRMLNGANFEPAQPAQQTFADVPLDAWYAKWVQAAHEVGLITGCATSPELRFCPNDPLTRALAAYMMVKAKGLSLP